MADGIDWGAAFANASGGGMQVYDDVLVPRMFVPWAELLLDHVAPREGESVLDVACGPGTVARRAAHRVGSAGRVTGCDLSPAMLAIARGKPAVEDGAPIEYFECPADALAVPDDTYDVVVCQQGLQFFPDRPAAVREMKRAARSGARIGVAVWCASEENPPFHALGSALGEVLGPDMEHSYRGGPWGFHQSEPLRRLFEDAGFSTVAVQRHVLPVEFEGGPAQLLSTLAAAPVAATIAELGDTGQSRLAEAFARHVAPLMQDGAIRSETATHIVTATA